MTREPATFSQDAPQSQEGAEDSFEEPGLSFGDLFRTLLKHKWFILLCTLLGLAISVVYARLATPIYEASAIIRIDPTRASSLGLNEASSSSTPIDPLKTEAEIVRSDAVIMAALNSLPDDQFNDVTGLYKGDVAFPSSLSTAAAQPEDRLNDRTPDLSPAQENIIATVKSQLSVGAVGDTQLLRLVVRSPNPEADAILANHIIAAYLRSTFDSRYTSVTQVQTWLSAQLNTLKQRANQSQKRLADFQEKNNIVGADNTNNNTVLDRLRQLNDRLTTAQVDRLVKEAQLKAAQSGDVGTLATLYPNVGLSSLLTQQAALYGRFAELSAKFGPSYPPLAEVIAQRKSVDDQIDRLVETTRNRLRQDYQVSQNTEDLLRQQFAAQTQAVYALNSKQADYAALIAESNADRTLYDRLEYELEQAGVAAGLSAVNTMVVTSARAPHVPVLPKKMLIVASGFLIGLFTGAASSFLVEMARDRLQSVSQAEGSLKLPTLTTIPRDVGLQSSKRTLGTLPLTFRQPRSRVTESFRTLRNSMLLSFADSSPKVILLSSVLGGEGTTTLLANYGVVLAQSGARVLLVDMDLRQPELHTLFDLQNDAGLSDLLEGRSGAAAVVRQPIPELANLAVLTAGKEATLPSELLASNRLEPLMEEWRHTFDFVLLDSAPLMVVSDTVPIARWADAVVLITRFDVTPMAAAQKARDLLRRAHARVAGLVINDVPANGSEFGLYNKKGYYNTLETS